VEEFSDYNINFVKLSNGSHHFEYKLGNAFFQAFENSLITEADIFANVTLHKEQPNTFDLDFDIKGKVMVTCDRCLDDFALPIANAFNLMVKLTDKIKENEHDITYMSFSDYQINVASYLYEICTLALPMKMECKDSGVKQCNEEVEKKLEELDRAKENDADQDPRWDALKNLVKNKDK